MTLPTDYEYLVCFAQTQSISFRSIELRRICIPKQTENEEALGDRRVKQVLGVRAETLNAKMRARSV